MTDDEQITFRTPTPPTIQVMDADGRVVGEITPDGPVAYVSPDELLELIHREAPQSQAAVVAVRIGQIMHAAHKNALAEARAGQLVVDPDLQPILDRYNKATPGTWWVNDVHEIRAVQERVFSTQFVADVDPVTDDGAFIIQAHNTDIPDLLAEVTRLRGIVAAQNTREDTNQ